MPLLRGFLVSSIGPIPPPSPTPNEVCGHSRRSDPNSCRIYCRATSAPGWQPTAAPPNNGRERRQSTGARCRNPFLEMPNTLRITRTPRTGCQGPLTASTRQYFVSWRPIHASMPTISPPGSEVSPGECAARITELERACHITGYTLIRSYPDPALRPISAVITVVQDRSRTGADLLRSLDFIPEIVTVEMSNKDRSLLLRVQTTKPGRIESIASALRIQSAVESVDVTPTTLVLSHLGL